MRISDWSSDVCSSDLLCQRAADVARRHAPAGRRGARGGNDQLLPLRPSGPGIAGRSIPRDHGTGARTVERPAPVSDDPDQGIRGGEQVVDAGPPDRKRVVKGKSSAVRLELGGRRRIKKKK